MKAKDIMTTRVVTVPPDLPVQKIAKILIAEGISAVPVTDENGVPLGVVSEGDLIARDEDAREARQDWWLSLAAGGEAADLLARLTDRHRLARDVMASPVMSVDEEASVVEIARLLTEYRIKRVPVLRDGRVVGIVSRADLMRALAAEPTAAPAPPREGFLGRAFAELDGHFGLHRHQAAGEQAISAPARRLSAEEFQLLTENHHRDEVRQRGEQRRAAVAARDHLLSELAVHHISDQDWDGLMAKAREAAKAGLKEYMLLRFPSQLCSDGGRAINISEPDWQSTLRGEAAELYLRWERDLRPQGFHLAAQVLDFPGGFPGDIGLFLIWGR